jgi:hypothetical protein
VPVHDWQFWVVTAIAVVALWYLLRSILPPSLGGKRRKGVSARLTIGGKARKKG